MPNEKQKLEAKAEKQLGVVMGHLGRLNAALDALDATINEFRGLGVKPNERQFYISKRFQWAKHHMLGLRNWEDKFNRTFGKVG